MKLEPQVKWLDIVTRTMDVFIAESRCDRHPFSLILQQSPCGMRGGVHNALFCQIAKFEIMNWVHFKEL